MKFKPPIALQPDLGRELIAASLRGKLKPTGICSRGNKKAGMQVLGRPRNVLLRGLHRGAYEQSTQRSAEAKDDASYCLPGLRAPYFKECTHMIENVLVAGDTLA